MAVILVTGFGAFLDVVDNPSGRLARAVDGAEVAGWRVVGREIPVSYARGVAATVALAREVGARLVLGTGVARSRDDVDVEAIGYAAGDPAVCDVDGVARGPAEGAVAATLDVARLAEALGARRSEDAGRYVCNGWLYDVVRALPDVPVGFLHMSPAGVAPERLLTALAKLVG